MLAWRPTLHERLFDEKAGLPRNQRCACRGRALLFLCTGFGLFLCSVPRTHDRDQQNSIAQETVTSIASQLLQRRAAWQPKKWANAWENMQLARLWTPEMKYSRSITVLPTSAVLPTFVGTRMRGGSTLFPVFVRTHVQGDDSKPQDSGNGTQALTRTRTPVKEKTSVELAMQFSPATLDAGEINGSTIVQELAMIQEDTPKNIIILGTQHCPLLHQKIIEVLSYALVLSENHIFTSGGIGTNAAAIRGALRAKRPDLLTVILPQSVTQQPAEMRELIAQVQQVTELGHDSLPLREACRICNSKLISKAKQAIVFRFHDSGLLREMIAEAKANSVLTTVFFLD